MEWTFCLWLMVFSVSVLVDPIQEMCDPCINTRKSRFGTFVAKRYDSNLSPSSVHVQHKRSTGITLACVFASIGVAGTNEHVRDGLQVGTITVIITPYGQFNFAQQCALSSACSKKKNKNEISKTGSYWFFIRILP